jgi:C-terminal processing protease CtpA/Prc
VRIQNFSGELGVVLEGGGPDHFVYVGEVVPGSAAYRANISQSNRIVQVNAACKHSAYDVITYLLFTVGD